MKPDVVIKEEKKSDEYTTLTIDTNKSTYHGVKWKDMGDFGKRKFYNWVVMTRAPERVKLIYV